MHLLNPILDELAREGRIRITVGEQGDIVSLISGWNERIGQRERLVVEVLEVSQ
jgi:hypothetical protein